MRKDEKEILERWAEENQSHLEKLKNLEKLKKTGKKIKGVGILRMLFGRTTVVVGLILLQLYVFYLLLTAAMSVSQYINMALGAISLCIFVSIVNSNMNSSFKMAWVTPMLLVPVFASVFYLYCQLDLGKRRLIKKSLRVESQMASQLKIDENRQKEFIKNAPDEQGMLYYFRESIHTPAFPCEYAEF